MLLLAIVGAVGLIADNTVTGKFTLLSRGYAPASDANAAALVDMVDAETSVRGYLISHEPSYLQPYQQSAGKALANIGSAGDALHRVGQHALDGMLQKERSLARRWLTQIAGPIASSPPDRTSIDLALQNRGKQMFDEFRAANEQVATAVQTRRVRIRSDALRLKTVATAVIIGATVLGLFIGTLYGLRVTGGLVRPLAALWAVVRRLGAGEYGARANADTGPVEVRAVASAINTLGAQVEAAVKANREAEALRAATVPLTASLRIGVEPMTMCQGLITGMGAVFGVDRVWLHTFDDNRVSPLTLQWHRPGLPQLPEPKGGEIGGLRSLANRLWHAGGVVEVGDHAEHRDLGEFQALVDVADRFGATASVTLAIGDASSAFGLLWVACANVPHPWTPTELSQLTKLAADLGRSLVQNSLLTRQQNVIAQLRELDEAKNALVSTVSHELRTPLTSISGYVEMLLDGDGGALPPTATEMLQVVDRNATRLRSLIEDLLTQSRIEAGRLRTTVTRIDLHEVLTDVTSSIEPIAESGGVELRTQLPEPGTLCIEGDLRQLEQAVTNLLANAVKFTPAGGRVDLVAEAADPSGLEADIIVRDTGIGIPRNELPQLFDRFFRASNAAEAQIPGTGLGLTIVHEIVLAHGGQLDVKSEVGVGTTFRIRLPLASGDSADPAAEAAPNGPG